MNYYVPCCFIVLLGATSLAHAEAVTGTSNFWQCATYDATNKKWTSQSIYEKVAMNVAFSSCKRESTIPSSCSATRNNCEQYVNGLSIKPMWVCTALDKQAHPWRSNLYSYRDDAAFAAKDYCRQNSAVPETCYVNFITCVNKNEINR